MKEVLFLNKILYHFLSELTDRFIKSRDYDELKQYWNDFRAVTGRKVKSDFLEYVKLKNEGARLNGK